MSGRSKEVVSAIKTATAITGVSKKKTKEGKSGKKGKSAKSTEGDDKGKSGGSKTVDILDKAAMENAHNICHNVQDLLYFRGFFWDGQNKKGKGKARKKKGKGAK